MEKRKLARYLFPAAILTLLVMLFILVYHSFTSNQLKAVAVFDEEEAPLTFENREDIPYLPLGSEIRVTFDGKIPASIAITDIITDHDGVQKYDSALDTAVHYQMIGNSLVFVLEDNLTAALSADLGTEQDESLYRWYRITFTENGAKKELGLWIKTDPPIRFSE